MHQQSFRDYRPSVAFSRKAPLARYCGVGAGKDRQEAQAIKDRVKELAARYDAGKPLFLPGERFDMAADVPEPEWDDWDEFEIEE